MQRFVREQYKCWNDELLPALAKHQIRVLALEQLHSQAADTAKKFYDQQVYPMLTPVTVDPSHPFPHVLNKALCVAFLLQRRRRPSEKPLFGWSPCHARSRAFCGYRREMAECILCFYRT